MLLPLDIHWQQFFQKELLGTKEWSDLRTFVNEQRRIKGSRILPSELMTFRALDQVSPHRCKVVILGQDPYPNSTYASGLAFGTKYAESKFPGSLKNIMKAVKLDTGIEMKSGDLMYWAAQGVLLLNTVLTVEEGKPGSHAGKGWEFVTDAIISELSASNIPKVFMLWGKQARAKKRLITNNKHLVLETSHPSPFSVHHGFMFSRHFSQANQWLESQGLAAIDWATY